MNVDDLFDDLAVRGVRLSVIEGTSIQVRAPKGVLTTKDRAALSEHKAELLELLHWFDTLPDVIVIPASLPNNEVGIRACIDGQRRERTAA